MHCILGVQRRTVGGMGVRVLGWIEGCRMVRNGSERIYEVLCGVLEEMGGGWEWECDEC